jgi:pimeloyl-ACP methyl ester carboxylesterase
VSSGHRRTQNISALVLLISGDHDGMDKMELIKTYQLLGGAGTADFGAVPKSQLTIVPGQGHATLMMQTQTILGYLDSFLK